ncbi:predicted protein [Histoplasma mississippiense (nom. inval.)]|uniref:predicted protein n=1 Tax=Ajellomyces capsulatus (strain NAm1 / WU24) TaxID=2059318 RepID=UPI000157D024|nr:predicted protein [Histoplasma mississippiense (nom. inval.)]EDN11221.1 predicted protein [Histoplasma mississippiense (nom. inval.)]
MAGLSQEDRIIIKNHPLTNLVDRLQDALQEAERIYESRLIFYNGAVDSLDQLFQNVISKLVYTLQGEGAAYSLPSRINDGNMASDLAQLFERLQKAKETFRYNDYQPLVHLIIQRPSTESQNAEPWNFDVWKAVFTLIDTLPQRTTPPASVPPSFDSTPVKSTSSSQKGSEQTHPDSDGNWAQFPDPPSQDNVLAWWFRLQEDLLSESRSTYYTTASKADLTGSQAERQVDLLLRARGGSPLQNKHDWTDILVVGELKKPKEKIRTKATLLQISCSVREVFAAQPTRRFVHAFTICGTKMEAWVFDRAGPYSSVIIDVYADSRRFFQVLVGYTMMSDEELGLDTFIARDEGGNKSITVKGPGNSEEKVLQLGEMLSFQRAIVCRGTTCFLANNGQLEGVAKFSWVSDKRRPEAELLELAGQRNVQGVARIIGHSTITNIADMRRDMAFNDRRHDFKSATPSTTSSFHQSQPLTEPCRLDICRKSSSRKRRSPDKGMQTFKRSRPINQTSGDTQDLAFSVQSAHKPSLFDRNGEELYDNRVLRCLVISPAGRPIYKYESPLELLKALRDAIKAHRSLYLDGNILHRDISENNIIITDPNKADGYSGTLIDLDLAKEVGSGRSGARHQTGTMEFMAIEVLLNIDHTYRHDLESFFYVLIWQCARHGWGKDNHPNDSKLRAWYTGNYEDIANAKLGHMSKAENMGFGFILREFPPKLHGVVPLCGALRDILFPYNDKGLIVGTPQDPIRLYDPIIKAYDDTIAQFELGNLTSDKSV